MLRAVVVRCTTVLVSLMFVVSCSGLLKKKGGEDAGPDAAAVVADTPAEASAPVPGPTALATNEGDVARFPDETKLANVAATLQRPYNAREAPPAGTVVVGLPKGASVVEIAQRQQYFLVTFDHPTTKARTMGWLHKDAFSAVIQDAGPLVCPTGEIALFGDVPFCGKLCKTDPDCPGGQACKGQANKLANGKAGDVVTVCTVFHAPATVDAGPPTVIDAGPAKVDAAAPPSPSPAADVVAATNGQCPGNFVLVKKTGKCHRPCTTSTTATECKNRPSYFCVKCDNDTKRVCADTRDQCSK
jgi:hypothetical protein